MRKKGVFEELLTPKQDIFAPKLFNFQLFADEGDGGDDGSGDDDTDGDDGDDGSDDNDDGEGDAKKYSDADVDRLLNRKYAEWQRKQEKKVSEAQKLAEKSASKKAEDRIKDLEDKVNQFTHERAHTEMMAQARSMLQAEDINISDELIENIVTDEADSTEENINKFVKLFRAEVGKAVKEKLKGGTPKKGSGSKITKEEIFKVKNPIERQRLIQENIDLFK